MESGEGGQFSKINRRTVLKTGIAAAALAVGGVGVNEVLKRKDDQVEEIDPKELFKDEWKEEIDSVTAGHLFAKYKDGMDSKFYSSDESKQNFFNTVTQLSARVNSLNNNLANQLAAVMCYETKGAFSPITESAEKRGGRGLFLLTHSNVENFGLTEKQVGELSPTEQLTLFGKILEREGKKHSGDFAYNRLVDLMLAKMHPTVIGAEYSDVLYTDGSDAYDKNKEFDNDNDGELTIEEIETVVKDFALKYGEKSGFLESPSDAVAIKESEEVAEDEREEEAREPDDDDQTDEELENASEAKADNVTAEYLAKIYDDALRDKYFTTDERKLHFMRELTRIAARLNPENQNLANQIAAVINFETAGTFSSSIQNESTEATGLIQFMPSTAEDYGTTVKKLRKMSPLKQLKYVEAFLRDKQNGAGVKFLDISDVYMAVLWPLAVGERNDHVLFNNTDIYPEAYIANSGLDIDGNGIVLKGEAGQCVVLEAIKRNEVLEYLKAPQV